MNSKVTFMVGWLRQDTRVPVRAANSRPANFSRMLDVG